MAGVAVRLRTARPCFVHRVSWLHFIAAFARATAVHPFGFVCAEVEVERDRDLITFNDW